MSEREEAALVCPFCKHNSGFDAPGDLMQGYQVECEKCGALGPLAGTEEKAYALFCRASSQAESGEDSIADALHEAVSRYLIRNPDRNDDEALCDALNTYEGYMRSRLTPPPPSSAEEGRHE